MKKYAILFILLSIFLATPVVMAHAATIKHAAPKTVKVIKKVKPTPTPKLKPTKKSVKGASTKAIIYSFFTRVSLVDCHMPDGKTIKASKKDCDSVNDFWNAHKPSNPGPSNNNNSGGSNNNSGGNSENHNLPTITNAEIMPCTSTSCGIITTVKVTGNNLLNDARVELTANGETYGEKTSLNYSPDAQLTGANGSTEIIMDFYNLAGCTTFGVQVAAGASIFHSALAVQTACH